MPGEEHLALEILRPVLARAVQPGRVGIERTRGRVVRKGVKA